MNPDDYLAVIAKQEKCFDAMYRSIGTLFGLPDCTMWVMYCLAISSETFTQQDLIEQIMFPKQTINSAVVKLEKKGLVELTHLPGSRKRKQITLTKAGQELAQTTVSRMIAAEKRAAKQLGEESMRRYTELYQEFYSHMEEEFIREGLLKKS